MKRIHTLILLSLFASLTFLSCDDRDDSLNVPTNLEVQNFIWKGLNLYYLWQADVPDLADDRFENQTQLNAFLDDFNDPFVLFDALRVNENIDQFSVLVEDYVVLENLFQGVSKNNGMEFSLRFKPGSQTEVFGVVNYIIPNSNASTKNISRGMIFDKINGTNLTVNNFGALLNPETYTVNFATVNGATFTSTGQSVELVKTELTENPIFLTRVIENNGTKVGYLMYNSFTSNFDLELNQAFGTLKNAGVTELVLDLRYNGGGSVQTATRLASMITGQYNGQLFAKQQWNPKVQEFLEENNPAQLVNNFTNSINGTTINSLNLSRVFILTTGATASASELVINGLKSYMNVVQIGTRTVGKNVGSITLYDSPTFSKEDVNTSHNYAMQPIVIKTVNKDGFGDYQNGLVPNIEQSENPLNMGVLGNETEPLLQLALNRINGNGRLISQEKNNVGTEFSNSKALKKFGNEMYIENNNTFERLK